MKFMPSGVCGDMDEKDLFERERQVVETADAILASAADNKTAWYDHYEKLLNEFRRVVKQSKRLIKLGDIFQLRLKTVKERLSEEIENHRKTQIEKEAFQARVFQSQKMEALATLVGGVAHDFNNILQVMLGYTELMSMDKKNDDPDLEKLKTVIEAGKGGAELVKKLLAFVQQGKGFPVTLDLNHQLRDMISKMSPTLPQTVDVELSFFEGPAPIYADLGEIDQILMNLVQNALEAMPLGGRLGIRTSIHRFNDENYGSHQEIKPGKYVMLSVTDTGSGMDKETLARMFDPFFTTKQRGTTRGTGLGLSVVTGIVQQNAWFITCDSQLGKGAEFKIFIPLREGVPEMAPETVSATDARILAAILVVEDNLLVAELERKILQNAGYQVFLASTGSEAVEIFKERRDEISLVMLDLIMPNMSGVDCLKEIMKIDPDATVIVLSGYSPESDFVRQICPHIKGFLRKPWQASELLNSVRVALHS